MSLLTMTSHHHLHHSHNTLTMHKSNVVSRQTPSPPQFHLTSFNHGTRVVMQDLFGNMPVRIKQRAISAEKQRGNSKEWDVLRRNVVLLLLAWPRRVAVAVREVGTNEKLLIRGSTPSSIPTDQIDISTVCTILSQTSLISVEDKRFWVSARASTQKISISGAISLIPSATKKAQFISFGIHPLISHDARSVFHDEINQMFLNSAFGNDVEGIELDDSEINRRAKDGRYKRDGYTNKELRGGKKGVDRWPMFYINIQQNATLAEGKSLDIDDILDDKGNSLEAIMELLQAMIWEFLTKHHFRPKASRGRRWKTTTSNTISKAPELELSKHSAELALNMQLTAQLGNASRKASKSMPLEKIKLPSSRLPPSRVDAPFDMWTRIKSGSRPTTFSIPEKVQTGFDEASIIPRPFSTPPYSAGSALSLAPEPTLRSAVPLLSRNGKIIRRPFEDVAISTSQSRISAAASSKPRNHSDEQSEDLIAWVNPVTKVKSLVNQRTGLTIRAGPGISNNTLSSTARRLPNREKLIRNIFPLTEEPSTWLDNILKTWNNPVFCPTEPSIPRVSFDSPDSSTQEILHRRHHHCSQIDIDRAFNESSTGIDGRISKAALNRAHVVSQIDNKFILVKLEPASMPTAVDTEGGGMLVLIDQHAADERVRIETLWKEFFNPLSIGTTVPIASSVATKLLDKPIIFEISLKETWILHKHKEHFTRWGIIFDLPPNITQSENASKNTIMQRLAVRSLPPGIIERCKQDPRLLIDLIRTEAWKIDDGRGNSHLATEGDWLDHIQACPQGITDMLNSRACRSAIMFNDKLSKEQCKLLVSRLAKCRFPFQCAHGRPCLVPLVDLGQMEMRSIKQISEGHWAGGTYGAAFNKWREHMK
jgi:DNA mismatch repair protein MLH3